MAINYFLIGVLFGFYVEYWNNNNADKTPFDNWHRIIIIVLWPVLVLVGISSFFKNK